MAVAILRVERGLDYSRVLGEDTQKSIYNEEPRTIQPNDSTTDLLANSQIHGSNDSLSRNVSQGKLILLYGAQCPCSICAIFIKSTIKV